MYCFKTQILKHLYIKTSVKFQTLKKNISMLLKNKQLKCTFASEIKQKTNQL